MYWFVSWAYTWLLRYVSCKQNIKCVLCCCWVECPTNTSYILLGDGIIELYIILNWSLVVLLNFMRGVLKSLMTTVNLFTSLNPISFCLIQTVFGAYTFRILFFVDWLFYHHVMSLCLWYFLCSEVDFVLY